MTYAVLRRIRRAAVDWGRARPSLGQSAALIGSLTAVALLAEWFGMTQRAAGVAAGVLIVPAAIGLHALAARRPEPPLEATVRAKGAGQGR